MKIYRLRNNFDGESIAGGSKIEESTSLNDIGFNEPKIGSIRQPQKFITLPFLTDFRNNGYQDLINKMAQEEKEKNVNTVIDRETIKYTSAIIDTQEPSSLNIRFNFFNRDTQTYGEDWVTAGFTNTEINEKRNSLTKSFFKLDFYDSDEQNNKNYLFSEFLNVNLNGTTTFPFTRLYWLKNDPNFIQLNTYRTLYFDATFFNAKDGSVRRFINRYNQVTGGITLTQYRDNKQWRYAKLRVLNPYGLLNNSIFSNNRLFYVEQPYNNNTDSEIIFSEIEF